MAKLTRKTAKVFGATATTSGDNIGIGQFGSARAGSYVGTNDVATIQNLTAWSNGWSDAVTETQNFPPLPEMTGVQYVSSYQNAYLLQEGIAEYDSGTTYYIGSIVKVLNNSNKVVLYQSLTDNNTGNPVSNTTHWQNIYSSIFDIDNAFIAMQADFENGETRSLNVSYQATENGWVAWRCDENDGARNLYLSHNGTDWVIVGRVRAAASNDACGSAALVPVAQGDYYKCDKKGTGTTTLNFYPLKGGYNA